MQDPADSDAVHVVAIVPKIQTLVMMSFEDARVIVLELPLEDNVPGCMWQHSSSTARPESDRGVRDYISMHVVSSSPSVFTQNLSSCLGSIFASVLLGKLKR